MMNAQKTMFCLLWFCGLGMLGPFSSVQAQTRYRTARYNKPMFAYLGITGRAWDKLPRPWQELLEKALRARLENDRFHFIKLASKEIDEDRFVQKMTKLVAARAMGIAKMRAAWDTEFQGYAVTTKLLRSVQNNAYYYWIEVEKCRRPRKLPVFEIVVTLHIRRLSLFLCTSDKLTKGEAYQRACHEKQPTEYAGLAHKLHVVRGSSMDAPQVTIMEIMASGKKGGKVTHSTPGGWLKMFHNSVSFLSGVLFKRFANLQEFQIHAPIESASFGYLTTAMGRREGLKRGSWLRVFMRQQNGSLRFRGFARVRRVGDNRMVFKKGDKVRANQSAPYLTRAQIVSTVGGINLQKGMMLYEHPMAGFTFSLHAGMVPFRFDTGAQNQTVGLLPIPIIGGTGLTIAPRLMFSLPLTKFTNIDEFYLQVGVELGLVGSAAYVSGLVSLLAPIGIYKKYYFFRNLAWMGGIRLCLGAVGAKDLRNPDPDNRGYANFLIGAEAVTGFDIFIRPEFSLALRGGFRAITTFNTGISGHTPEVLSLGPWFSLGGIVSF